MKTLSARIGPRPAPSDRSGATRFKPAERIDVDIKEPSDLTMLPGGRIAVVGDLSPRMLVQSANGDHVRIKLSGIDGDSEFEGITFDPVKEHLFVSREEKRHLLRYDWDGSPDKKPKFDKRIKLDLDGPKNKGVEGLAHLPKHLSPTGQAQLLAVREGKPRQLLMFKSSGGGDPVVVQLDAKIHAHAKDFSAITVDPLTGHVFVGSDQSATVVELRLSMDKNGKVRADTVSFFSVRDEKGRVVKRIEGLAFNKRGDLLVLSENRREILRLSRTR